MRRNSRLLLLAAPLVAVPAYAQVPREDIVLDNWRISQAIPNVCQAITRVDDHLNVNIAIMKPTGRTVLFLESDELPRANLEKRSGTISWDNWVTSQQVEFTLTGANGRGVLVAQLDPSFATDLRDKKSFWVKVHDVSLDREVALEDIDRAFAAVDICLKTL